MAAKRESSSGKTKQRTSRKSTKQDDAPVEDDKKASAGDDSPAADDDFGTGIEQSESDSSESSKSEDRGENQQSSRPRRRRRGPRSSSEQRSQGSRGGGGGGGGGGSDRRRRSSSNQGSSRNSRGNRPRTGGKSRSGGGRTRSDSNGDRSSREPKEINITGTTEGVLELHPKGYGFIRDKNKDYLAQEYDPFVSSSLVEKYGLREGVYIVGEIGEGIRSQGPRLYNITTIDGNPPEDFKEIKLFDNLTAINPVDQIKLETGPTPVTMRVMDLLTPLGKGQRALLVAPPRTGKTMLLQDIANAVSINHPEIHLIVLLIDERPEEVTEMRRSVNGEVIASSMDNDVESHIRVSQLIFERGKRLAESGKDVLILLDSITRTARAFNKWINNTGRTMSGGLDVKAMDIPKKMFGTARLFDEGGSLTVVGTALIDTGSRMDEVIFQEFKGTGNMELVLSRNLADRRIWPAIDITKSGTRREEIMLDPDSLESITLLRRSLISLSPVEAMEQLTRTLSRFTTNDDFLAKVRDIL